MQPTGDVLPFERTTVKAIDNRQDGKKKKHTQKTNKCQLDSRHRWHDLPFVKKTTLYTVSVVHTWEINPKTSNIKKKIHSN